MWQFQFFYFRNNSILKYLLRCCNFMNLWNCCGACTFLRLEINFPFTVRIMFFFKIMKITRRVINLKMTPKKLMQNVLEICWSSDIFFKKNAKLDFDVMTFSLCKSRQNITLENQKTSWGLLPGHKILESSIIKDFEVCCLDISWNLVQHFCRKIKIDFSSLSSGML